MTALEKIKDMIDFCDAIGCHRALYESLKAVEAELETLKQPKNCDGCKFHDDVGWDDWCCDCIRKWTIDRYEAKEQ